VLGPVRLWFGNCGWPTQGERLLARPIRLNVALAVSCKLFFAYAIMPGFRTRGVAELEQVSGARQPSSSSHAGVIAIR